MKDFCMETNEGSNTIIYVGSLPKDGQPPLGGGEQGNMRSVWILKSSPYRLTILRKPRVGLKVPNIIRVLSYPFRTLYLLLKLFICLIRNNKNYTIVHWVGFYGTHIVVVDNIALQMIKLMGFRVVYEIRGAGIIDYNNDSSDRRKKRFENVIQKADFIFSQGLDNRPLVEKVSPCKRFFYYPNFIEDDFLPQEIAKRDPNRYNIIYFGRLEEGKNILMIIDIISKLMEKYENVFFTLVGSGLPDYVKKVLDVFEKLPQQRRTYFQSVKHSDLVNILQTQHFFVFPTEREGHSNALTEAMSLGVVPIVSNRGFNKTVLSEDSLVVDDLEEGTFVDRISSIIDNCKWSYYSEMVHQRVKDNFTYSQVSERLLKEYSDLFELIQKK